MDKALKAKWLEALRSGKYKQGRGKLRSVDDEFCCLGVLCDISGQGEWETLGDQTGYLSLTEREYDWYQLPQFMMKFSGIRLQEQRTLMVLNDIKELSFPEIANWIEENVPED